MEKKSSTIMGSVGPNESPFDLEGTLDALLLIGWAKHFGLPPDLTPRNCYDLAVRLAKELEAKQKKKVGRPANLRTGVKAIRLAAEIRAIISSGEGKDTAIQWLHENVEHYANVKFATFEKDCHDAIRYAKTR